MDFPTVFTESPDGQRFVLPADFEGKFNAVVIAFQQRQQTEVETWLPLFQSLSDQTPELSFYVLATMQQLSNWQHEYADVGTELRRAVGEHVLALYVDLNRFNRALDLPTVSRIYVLLLDQSGRLMWRVEGECTAEKEQQLRHALAQSLARPAFA